MAAAAASSDAKHPLHRLWPAVAAGGALLAGTAAALWLWKRKTAATADASAPTASAAAGSGAGAASAVASAPKPAGPLAVEIVAMRAEHVDAAARLTELTFDDLARRTALPRDFPDGLCAMMFGGALQAPASVCHAVVALQSGMVVGCALVDASDGVAAVGPVTVSPACQSRGVGAELARALLRWCQTQGHADVRLVALTDAKALPAWAVYAKLGFGSECFMADFRGYGALLTLPAPKGVTVRAMEAADESACAALYESVARVPTANGRRHGLAAAAHSSWARLVACDSDTGAIRGFTTGFRVDGWTVARDQVAVQALLQAYAQRVKALPFPDAHVGFYVPLKPYPALISWLLNTAKLQVKKQAVVMCLRAPNAPGFLEPKPEDGIYLPNTGF